MTTEDKRVSGVWSLETDRWLDEIVSAVNACLHGRHVLSVALDTDSSHRLMQTGYTHMSDPARVGGGESGRFVEIPVGLGVRLYVRPVEFEGQKHWPFIEVNGDHVVIAIPYVLGGQPTRLDHHHYSFTRRRPLGE